MEKAAQQILDSAIVGSQWTPEELEDIRNSNMPIADVLATMKPLPQSVQDYLIHGITPPEQPSPPQSTHRPKP